MAQNEEELSVTPIDEKRSSSISGIGWHETLLHVDFRNGSTYRYLRVPRTVWIEFMEAPLLGKFLNTQIKGKYDFHRIS